MKIIKKYKYAFLSSFIPIIIFSLLFFIKKIPYSYNFVISDALSQYLPTFEYLHNVLHGNASFPYTFTKGLGGTMYAAYFYGLSSPINLLVYFFDDIELFMMLSTILKISLSGFTMFLLLISKNRNNKISFFFSLAYSLSGYVSMYYIHIMWLDGIWLAPLVVMGIDQIIHKKKDFLYITTLLTSLISNYYIGYMIVLFSIIYFIYQLYIEYNGQSFLKDNKKSILHFLLITFLTGSLIMVILIPIFIESLNYNRVAYDIKYINFNYLDLFSGTYIGFGNITKPLNYYGLLIYCSTVTLPLIIYYFTSKSTLKKEKLATIIVFLILLLPVIIKPLSYIWHLFTWPQGFNYRYSFLIILFILIIASNSLKKMDGSIKILKYYIIFYIMISISLLFTACREPDYYIYLNYKKIILTIFFIVINYFLIKKQKKNLILFIMAVELFLNISIIFYESNFLQREYSNQYIEYLTNELNTYNNSYRLETTQSLSLNTSLQYNYNGITTFLSSNNKNAFEGIYKINGINRDANFFKYLHYNMINDILLGVKYVSDTNLNPEYETIKTYKVNDKAIYFQRNDYALSLGFMSSDNIKNLNNNNFNNFEYLNELLNRIDGQENNYFDELIVAKCAKNKFIIKKEKTYNQIFIISKNAPNNIEQSLLFGADEYGIYYDNTEGDIILEFESDVQSIQAFALNTNKLKDFVSRREQLVIDKNEGNYLTGKIEAKTDGVFVTTIPYEKGWKIYVNGKETPYYKIIDSFIAIDLQKGNHKIEFLYYTPGLNIGICASLISLIFLIAYETRKVHKNHFNCTKKY